MAKTADDFFPSESPIAIYGEQFGRNMTGSSKGMMEVNTPLNQIPANAQLFIEISIPTKIQGDYNDRGKIFLIYKDNHNAEGSKRGKHNVIVTLDFIGKNDDSDTRYTKKVELSVKDDHNVNRSPKELENVKYQNTDVLNKYNPGGDPIKAKGSYQDTKDGGIRYKLEILNPDSKEWKKIFDHVDYGDEIHDIKNYRGSSAFQSSIRIDGATESFNFDDMDSLRYLEGRKINTVKPPRVNEALSKLGYGNITIKEIEPDTNEWGKGSDDPLSLGKKPSRLFWRRN
jgi:hypothetical protein